MPVRPPFFQTPTLFRYIMRLIQPSITALITIIKKIVFGNQNRVLLYFGNLNMRQMLLIGNHTFDVVTTIKHLNDIKIKSNTNKKKKKRKTFDCRTPYYYLCVFYSLEFDSIHKCSCTHMGVCVWVRVSVYIYTRV